MIQYLLETYALDDELAQAFIAVTTAKQAEKETEKALDAGYIDSLSELAMSLTSRILRPFTWKNYLHFSKQDSVCT
jgi:hypothetical protein